MRNDYNATREAVRDTLTPFGPNSVKKANAAMKALFGDRLSQIRGGQSNVTYYISVYEDGEWEIDAFSWDFFYHDFA